MSGVVIYSEPRRAFVEFVPFDGEVFWSGGQDHAHVFTRDDAESVVKVIEARYRPLRVLPDYYGRAPKPVPANAQLHGDGWCECHCTCGKPLDERGWCDNCDEPTPDYDAPTAGERAGLERVAQAEARKLK